ncbi:hypothetical protein EUX98_g6255 [Antrodiella citrinella]|uniref:Uncharacterized protein n=1 Tax=Antrodiella citrinella TaxID=2447956 RepID=A0A4S4MPR7_9APHY|nr:hypothetical protein EUX98_g6255 [Antrodiella citrinella]
MTDTNTISVITSGVQMMKMSHSTNRDAEGGSHKVVGTESKEERPRDLLMLNWDSDSDSDSDSGSEDLPPIPDPRKVSVEEWERVMTLHAMPYGQPLDSLPAEYDPTPENPKPRRLVYGIPVTTGALFDYAKWAGVAQYVGHGKWKRPNPFSFDKAVDLLSNHCRFDMYLKTPYLYLSTRHCIIEFWNNYNYTTCQTDAPFLAEMTRFIQSELGLDEATTQPKWFFVAE